VEGDLEMKMYMAAIGFLTLAACGVEGDPIRPSYNGTVSVGSNGTNVGVGTTLTRGNLSVGLGTSF
jgi:hypothetical protein